MEKLVSGIAKFQKTLFQEKKPLFTRLAKGQNPEVLFITCSDSRIDPTLITQTQPGDLFIARNAGNFVPPHFSTFTTDMDASIEFACKVLKVRHVVICGHTDCGAMKGALDPETVRHLPHVYNWLSHAAAASAKVKGRHGGELTHEHLPELIRENVVMQLKHLETHPAVAERLAQGDLLLHGWVYDIEHGEICCYEAGAGTFVPVSEHYAHILERANAGKPVAA